MQIERACPVCDKTFAAYPSEIKRGRKRFCSNSCKGKFARSLQDQSGPNNPAWRGGVWQENSRKAAKRWNAENPEKRRAHHAVEHALNIGVLKKEPCERCGATENVDGHHENYDEALNVEWLCRRCHLAEHRQVA